MTILPYVLVIIVNYGNTMSISDINFETYKLCSDTRQEIIKSIKASIESRDIIYIKCKKTMK